MAERECGEKVVKRDLNGFIDAAPFEMHIPTFNYCGPGTKLESRLANKEAGVNKLDDACKSHDIVYTYEKDPKARAEADWALAKAAAKRLIDQDTTFMERSAAIMTAVSMLYKSPLSENSEIADIEKSLLLILTDLLNGEHELEELKRVNPETIAVNKKLAERHRSKMLDKHPHAEGLGFTPTTKKEVIDNILLALQLPHYRYCDGGTYFPTNWGEKLEKNVKGFNELDEACKSRAIAYTYTKDEVEQAKSDLQLAKDAIKRARNRDLPEQDRIEAYMVALSMAQRVAIRGDSNPTESLATRALDTIKKLNRNMLFGEKQLMELQSKLPETKNDDIH